MRLRNQIRRRRINPNAEVEQNQERLLEMMRQQQTHNYEEVRLHFTGLILQGLSAHHSTSMPRAIEVAIMRGREMVDEWFRSLK